MTEQYRFNQVDQITEGESQPYPYLLIDIEGQPAVVIGAFDFDGTTTVEFAQTDKGEYMRRSETDRWTDRALSPARSLMRRFNQNNLPYGATSTRSLGECLRISEVLGVKNQGPIGPEDGTGLWIPGDQDPKPYLPSDSKIVRAATGWFVHTSQVTDLHAFTEIFDQLRRDGYEGKFFDTVRVLEEERYIELQRMSELLLHPSLQHTADAAFRMASAFLVTDHQDSESQKIRNAAMHYAQEQGLLANDYGDNNPVIFRPPKTDKFRPVLLYAHYIQAKHGIQRLHLLTGGNAPNDLELAQGIADPDYPQITGKMVFMAKGERNGFPIYHLDESQLANLPTSIILSNGIGPEGLTDVADIFENEILTRKLAI